METGAFQFVAPENSVRNYMFIEINIQTAVRLLRSRISIETSFIYKYMNPLDSIPDTKMEKRQIEMHPIETYKDNK